MRELLRTFRFSWLDFKLGFRMLARYPGITLVGTVAIAVAIALGTIYVEALNKFWNPRLPIRDGERVVSIRNWNVRELREVSQLLHDFAIWRAQSRTIENMGAALVFGRNLATADGRVEPVHGAEVTANAFALMRTPPLLGRVLLEQDEQPTEPPVVVIGYRLWQSRFARDPAVVGRTVKLGTVPATIVGVMPEGYRFPEVEQIWTPLRVQWAALAPGTGPGGVSIFGRLASGASVEAAQAELDAIAAPIKADNPETHRDLRPRVTTYEKPIAEGQQAFVIKMMMSVIAGIFLTLLAIMCTNVATLVYARTATRGWELTVRSALGAARSRIIAQLFTEALVLTGLAAVIGLVLARLALRWGLSRIGSDSVPFWIDDSISWKTMLSAVGLTLFGAAIVGILPALRATRVNVQDALRNEGAARMGLKFGGFWTTVIVVQVAITVALMPLAAGGVYEANRFMQRAEGIGAEHYLTASVDVDKEDYAMDADVFGARARGSIDELERRVSAEPGVEYVTFADRLPVMDQFKYEFEVDQRADADALHTSTLVQVSREYFATFGTTLVAGRDFAPIEYENGRVLIVNESFVRYAFKNRNAIGRRIRITDGEISSLAGDDWYEIIGVVKDFGWQLPRPWEQAAMYRPRLPLDLGRLVVRVRDPDQFADRLRTVAADVDPTIRLTNVQGLGRVGGGEAEMGWALTSVAWLVGFIVLTLSATGIHALVSFTVARRTREIGIRAALGARTERIVASVFARAFLQIGAGIVAGSALAAFLGGVGSPREILILVAADAIMLVVGLAACAVPLRRALSIHPTEALRAEV